MQNNASSLPISYNFHVMLLLVNVMFASKFASNPVNQWFLIKIPTSQWRAVHSRISNGIIFAADTMITQLQNLWLLYYIPTHYSSVLSKSLDYYRLDSIILTNK